MEGKGSATTGVDTRSSPSEATFGCCMNASAGLADDACGKNRASQALWSTDAAAGRGAGANAAGLLVREGSRGARLRGRRGCPGKARARCATAARGLQRSAGGWPKASPLQCSAGVKNHEAAPVHAGRKTSQWALPSATVQSDFMGGEFRDNSLI